MELLAGATRHQVLASGPLPFGALIDHASALADALHAAHARGIIHRDLKPASVFLTEHGTIKILDFGLANSEHRRAVSGKRARRSPPSSRAASEQASWTDARGEINDLPTRAPVQTWGIRRKRCE